MTKLGLTFYITMIVIIIASATVDAIAGVFDSWKIITLLWVVSSWLSELRASKIEKAYKELLHDVTKAGL
jgi:hypothetical protein